MFVRAIRESSRQFLLPKEAAFLKALPKSLVGKVLKKELRKL